MTRLITLTSALALAAGAAAAQDEPLKIGATVYGLNAEFMQIWSAALEQHPAVLSGEVDVTVFDGRYDALVQQDQFETMITEGFDAIIFVPMDVEAGAAAVQAAADAGIPVIGSNARVNSDLLTSYVGSDDVVSGQMEAQHVVDAIGCETGGQVVILEGPIGQSGQIQRLEGNMAALSACPAIEVIEQQTANWSRAEAQTLMENWLTTHGDEIDGVIGQNDEMALGAIEALKGAGMDPSAMPIVGIDGITDAINAVKAGEMFSILQDARAQAQGALDIAIFHARGMPEGFEPQSDIWNTYPDMPWNGGTEAIYNVPWTPVTPENADALLASRQ